MRTFALLASSLLLAGCTTSIEAAENAPADIARDADVSSPGFEATTATYGGDAMRRYAPISHCRRVDLDKPGGLTWVLVEATHDGGPGDLELRYVAVASHSQPIEATWSNDRSVLRGWIAADQWYVQQDDEAGRLNECSRWHGNELHPIHDYTVHMTLFTGGVPPRDWSALD